MLAESPTLTMGTLEPFLSTVANHPVGVIRTGGAAISISPPVDACQHAPSPGNRFSGRIAPGDHWSSWRTARSDTRPVSAMKNGDAYVGRDQRRVGHAAHSLQGRTLRPLCRLSPWREARMEDIDQSRFALMTALTGAHKSRPDEYPNPGILVAMSDDDLRAYALGLLERLDGVATGDGFEAELRNELRVILGDTR